MPKTGGGGTAGRAPVKGKGNKGGPAGKAQPPFKLPPIKGAPPPNSGKPGSGAQPPFKVPPVPVMKGPPAPAPKPLPVMKGPPAPRPVPKPIVRPPIQPANPTGFGMQSASHSFNGAPGVKMKIK